MSHFLPQYSQQQPIPQIGMYIPCLWCDESNYIYQSIKEYIDYKFNLHSRLLIIRLDLGFKDNTTGQYNAEYARACLQKLMNNKRKLKLFSNERGYVWSLEYGQDKGFHFHCFFIFDGSSSQQDQTIGHAIGQYWVNIITQGTGSYYCSNDDKAKFEAEGTLGIGMIHRYEHHKRANLMSIASYLAKDDALIKPMLPESTKGFRTFGRGEMVNS
ncbi:inovirus-type Gp2 protein [Chitinibacter fontanus]|uniref:Inovirus-type Gp2 protein n=1 Tax=Chitinibacter fontanus TaxID=1737446 RepID=A0A7D5ZEA5_9NEIS|nr:inovirus-type Gp2 protein [Chitinibacter fontanus]QLI80848.1 inovirus-type Gp2 protein [Chitinibacter fontanus]